MVIDLNVRDRVFPRHDVTLVTATALVICNVFWIYIIIEGYEPSMGDRFPFIGLTSVLNVITAVSYALLITMPFMIFRTMNVRIVTRSRSMVIYRGFL